MLASWAFDAELMRVGSLAIALSLVAMAWNYVYNLWFDHAMWRLLGRVRKTLSERVLHAFIFEFGMLLLTLLPVIWWLDRGVIQALNMSLSLMVFYLVYTYVYNLAYDWRFPIREPA